MILQPAGLDAMEVDALQTDRYLDALLAAIERRADDVPSDPAVDPTLRLAARCLRDEAVRTHPSFRFEERLARRLADAAAAAPAEVTLAPFRPVVARPLLVGGALTSAALSLAGAAFVAWRLTRGASTNSMARAARAARETACAAREAAVTTAAQATAAVTAIDATLGQRSVA